MKLYISMDMEGIPGTFNWEHEKHDPQAVKRYCFNHIRDLIQALEQCPENADLTDILIADSHSIGENLEYDITLLDERITLISGGPRP
ncbi:MAG: M55 family metallopeptidase, partial [Candidatus Cloacimonetes bacterium]|nr:M55 family metallopeptidase [Candidatus Cloacimonadota bacterium]